MIKDFNLDVKSNGGFKGILNKNEYKLQNGKVE